MKIRLRTVSIVLITILLTTLTATSALANPDLPSGLVALWTFEEGSGTTINELSGVGTAMTLYIEDSTHTTWTPAGALTMGGAGANRTILGAGVGNSSGLVDTKIAAAMRATNEFTIEAWVTPELTAGITGPARVVTLSDPASPTGPRNFALMQDGTIWDARMRESVQGASPGDFNPSGGGGGAYGVDVGSLTQLLITYDASGGSGTGTAILYVIDPSSCPATPSGFTDRTTGGDLSNWADSFHFSMANETGFPTSESQRDWRGQFHMVAIYDQALTPAEIATRCTEGSRQIFDELTISKGFSPNPVEPGQNSTLTFDLGNPAGNPAVGGVAFTDTLPGTVVVAAGVPTNSCGGTLTAPAAGNSIALSGGALAAGSSTCQITVPVVSASTGSFANTSSVVSSEQTQDSAAGASDTLDVQTQALTLGKAFAPNPVEPDQPSTITFTLTNPNSVVTATGVAFSDSLPGSVVVSSGATGGSCVGGSLTAVPGSGSISYSGGTLAPGSCTITVPVESPSTGNFLNTTSTITSNETPAGATASDTLDVSAAALTMDKAYSRSLILPNGVDSSSLSFTIGNPNAVVTATGVAFSDTLNANLSVGNLQSTCNGTPNLAGQTVSLSGASLTAGASCVVSVDVTSVVEGSYPNGPVVASSSNVPSSVGDSDTLNVFSGLAIGKAFAPSPIRPGDVSTLTFTINNGSASGATNVSFTDNLPAGVEVAAIPNVVGNCNGGTFAPAATDTTVSLTGGALASGTNCILSVDVTAALAGTYDNLSSTVTSNETPPGNQAAATLNVRKNKKKGGGGGGGDAGVVPAAGAPAEPTDGFISKSANRSVVAAGDAVVYTIVLRNPSDVTLTQVVVIDDLNSLLGNVAVSSTKGNARVEGNRVIVDGLELAPGESATVTIQATVSSAAAPGTPIPNQATLSSPDASVHYSNTAMVTVLGGQLPASGFAPKGILERALPYLLGVGGVLMALMVLPQLRRRRSW